ncbi:glycosyltransferase 87 family protein [Cellulomonas sp. GbtcB1]|uniref:glycosyltransferase 87 family protein n=1 Tax=Cellulomonas sp. GbtcB1 TaxID=2824746 RepID=UPI001C30FE1E|nr:glycosyltransferase 87 family protein [Cellulomonas sp. GbtcB1]
MHGWIAYVGTVLIPARAFWDLDLYRWWMWQGLHQGVWPVLDGDWVYPAGAVLPMLLPALVDAVGTQPYAVAWSALITLLDAAAVVVLLRCAGRPAREGAVRGDVVPPARDPAVGAWWWLAFVLLLGPVAVGRLDAVVAPVVVIALAVALRHPAVASALLTFGAWVKVAPGALLLPLVLVLRRPWRDLVLPAAAVCVAVAGAVAAGGGLGHLTSFLTEQGERGLQLESVAATPFVLAGIAGGGARVVLNQEITTWEIAGPGTAAVAGALGVALPVALAAVTGLLAWVRLRAGDRLDTAAFLARGALLVAVTLILANKVGSPQFVGWLAGPVVVGLARPGTGGLRSWRVPAVLVLVIAGLTQVVFPIAYDGITLQQTGPSLVLVLRNLLLVVLVVVVARDLARAGRAGSRATGPGEDARVSAPAA